MEEELMMKFPETKYVSEDERKKLLDVFFNNSTNVHEALRLFSIKLIEIYPYPCVL